MQKDKEVEIQRIKLHDDKILRQHTTETNELHRKLKKQKLEHEVSLSSFAQASEENTVKEKEPFID